MHDLDPVAWRNAQRLLDPPSRTGSRRRRAAPLILFIEGGRCVKALRPGGEPTRAADHPWSGSYSLGRLRRAAQAPWALAVEEGALERVFAELEGKVSAGDDMVAQSLVMARAARAEIGRGLHLDPDPLARVPIPPFAALQKTMDTLLPDGRSAALFVWDEARGRSATPALWTSIIVEKQGGDLVRVTTHAALGVARPELRGGAHKELLDALERRIARPHMAAFLTLDAWRDVVGPQPGALAQRVAARDAVLDPMPPWLLAFAGMGAVAGVAQEASRLFGRFVPQAVKDTARAVSPFAALGFDPIATFIELQKAWGGGSV